MPILAVKAAKARGTSVQGGSCGVFSVVDSGGRDGGAVDSAVVVGNGGAPDGGAAVPLAVRGRRTSRSCQPNGARSRGHMAAQSPSLGQLGVKRGTNPLSDPTRPTSLTSTLDTLSRVPSYN
eukprot:scaffold5290_cov63-Phaeocystis_antarctica.AAC.7